MNPLASDISPLAHPIGGEDGPGPASGPGA